MAVTLTVDHEHLLHCKETLHFLNTLTVYDPTGVQADWFGGNYPRCLPIQRFQDQEIKDIFGDGNLTQTEMKQSHFVNR